MAANGFLHGGVCYASQVEAVTSAYGPHALHITPGSTTYISSIYYDTALGVFRHKTYQVATNGLWTLKTEVSVVPPQFPACDPLPASSELSSAFAAGFILPMAGFVLAYVVGRLNAMFSQHG